MTYRALPELRRILLVRSYYQRLRQRVLRGQGLEFSADTGMTDDPDVTRGDQAGQSKAVTVDENTRTTSYLSC